jgi:hypothetical protein
MSENSPPKSLPQMELALMSSAEGSPAKTSLLRARARDLRASAAAYGRRLPDFLANYDPASSSWRTSQHCLVEGLESFSETWPRSGTTRNGIAYRLPPLVPLTDAIDFGSWPTPTSSDTSDRAPPPRIHITKNGTSRHLNEAGEQSFMRLSQVVRMWPTPTVQDSKNDGNPSSFERNSLSLHAAVKVWPTPGASDHKGAVTATATTARRVLSGEANLPEAMVEATGGGSLNPTWVEWLMGFPLGWTDLEPSATPSSRRSPK